jgi:hypothetical protein
MRKLDGLDVAHVDLSYVKARLAYLGRTNGRISYTVYPPSSGREAVSPPKEYCDVPVYDCRPMVRQFHLDREGFVLLTRDCDIGDFFGQAIGDGSLLSAN